MPKILTPKLFHRDTLLVNALTVVQAETLHLACNSTILKFLGESELQQIAGVCWNPFASEIAFASTCVKIHFYWRTYL